MCNEKKEMKKLLNEGCGGKRGVCVKGERGEEGGVGVGVGWGGGGGVIREKLVNEGCGG